MTKKGFASYTKTELRFECIQLRKTIIKIINKISISNIETAKLYKKISIQRKLSSSSIFSYIENLAAITKIFEDIANELDDTCITNNISSSLYKKWKILFEEVNCELYNSQKKYINLTRTFKLFYDITK